MRIGIIGCGLIGRRRALVVQQTAGDRLVLVADTDAGRAQALADETASQAASRWEAVIERQDIDAVVVATPNKFLMPAVVAALQSGKDVLCEKPPGRNAAETAQMVAAAESAGRILKVGFNHRHHPAIWQAWQAVSSGAIGSPYFIRAVYGHGGRPGYDQEWRADAELAGGGELLDQGVHIIDLCRWFLGEFKQVFASTGTYYWQLGYFPHGPRLEDNAFALLRTSWGQAAQFHTSWTQWKNRFSFEVYGEQGYARVEGLGGSYGVESLTLGRRKPASGPPDETTTTFEGPDTSWQVEWQEFRQAVMEGCQPLASGADGLRTMQVLAALYRSAASGQMEKVAA